MPVDVVRPNQWKRIGWLLRFVKPYRRSWASILVVTLLASALSVLQPWPMKILVDNVLGHQPLGTASTRVFRLLPGAATATGLIAWICIASLLLFALNSLFDVLLTYSWIRAGQAAVYALAAEVFGQLQRRSVIFHSRNAVGDLMSRVMTDSWCVHTLVDTLLIAPLHGIVLTGTMVVLMCHLNWRLTLVSLCLAPLMTGTSLLLGRQLRHAARAQRDVEAEILSHIQQVLTGIPIVQAFAQEQREYEVFHRFAGSIIQAARRSTFVSSLSGLGSGLVNSVGTGVVLWFGARDVLHGDLTLGGLLVFLTYLGLLQSQLGAFTGIYASLQGSGGSIDRIAEITEAGPEVKEKPGATAMERASGHVSMEDLTFGYETGQAVLKSIRLEARPGERIGIVGHTGAGKSTIMGLILRLFDPWEGRILLDGRDLRDLPIKSAREQVAVVFQEPFLFPITVAENIAFGRPNASRAEVQAAAQAANAHDFINDLPNGYDTLIGERGATLSGGQRQRLGIARAVLKNAPVLVLDEPTSALDALSEHQVMQALRELMKNRTTFIIAHRLSTVRDADKIAVLDSGQMVELGSHAQLLAMGGLYARMHYLQSGGNGAAIV